MFRRFDKISLFFEVFKLAVSQSARDIVCGDIDFLLDLHRGVDRLRIEIEVISLSGVDTGFILGCCKTLQKKLNIEMM